MINIVFGTEMIVTSSLLNNVIDIWRSPNLPRIGDTVHLKGRYYRVVRVTWTSGSGVYLQVDNIVSMNKKDKSQ